jgi:SOS-response transcriptional repressor LexA
MTPREGKALTFITDYIRAHRGVSPTFDEIGAALGIKGRGAVHALVGSLESQGFISRAANKARSLQLLNRLAGFTIAELDAEVFRREQEWAEQSRGRVASCVCGNRDETPEARDCQRNICPLRIGKAA